MSIKQGIIMELKHESANTNKMLERLSLEHFSFRPHEKSSMFGNLARHISELPGWITMTLKQTEFDLASRDPNRPEITSAEELQKTHNENVATALQALEEATDEDMMTPWTLKRGDHVIFTMPRAAVIRNMAMNHMIHHRGQLSVYMRMNGIPLPSIYGPSADEQ